MSDIDKTLCDEALKIVQGARREKYDKPERNFERIALAWQAITDRAYTASEVALMFVALKLVRESHAHQRDNLVDGIGYLLCADAVIPTDSEKSPYEEQKKWQAQQQSDSFASHPAATPLSVQLNAENHVGACSGMGWDRKSYGKCICVDPDGKSALVW